MKSSSEGPTLNEVNRRTSKRPSPGRRSARRRVRAGCRPAQFATERVRFLTFLGLLYGALVAHAATSNPLLSLGEAVATTTARSRWLVALVMLECLRQLHFVLAERSRTYWSAFTRGVRRVNAPFDDMRAYTRHQLSRFARALGWLVVGAVVLGQLTGVSPWSAWFVLPSRLFGMMPLFLQVGTFILFGIAQFGSVFWFLTRGGVEVFLPEDITTRFDQVWGQDRVVERLRELVALLEHPDEIEARGGHVPGGVLLWGPPGTGKTLVAEAMAGETGNPFVFVDPGNFNSMFYGVGVMKVRSLYRKLRKLAMRHGGVIVFFDEADVLGSRGAAVGGMGAETPTKYRSIVPGGRGGDVGTLNALLAEMNGLGKPRGFFNRTVRRWLGMRPKNPPKLRILHVMATNMPDSLDPALLRPGRIDYKFQMGHPSKAGRRRTFDGYLSRIRHELDATQVDLLAALTPKASGAVIKDMVNEAVMQALRAGRDEVTWADMLQARSVKLYGIADDFEYVPTERHTLAIHEASHAVAHHYLVHRESIDVVTIERRGLVGGFVQPIALDERFVATKSEREAEVCVLLASLAGERMFFDGDTSSGVSGDLESATAIVLANEARLGMGPTLAAEHVLAGAALPSHEPDRALRERIESRLQELHERVSALLSEHRHEVLALAHALETHRTLNGQDAVAVIEGRAGEALDGSIYASEQARAALEGYHEAVLGARRTGTSVGCELPVL